MSETSSLIFHHHCEGAVRGIHFNHKPDHIISLCKTLQVLPSHLDKAQILTLAYKVLHELPSLHPSVPSVPPAHPTPATLVSSLFCERTKLVLTSGPLHLSAPVLEISSFGPVVLKQGTCQRIPSGDIFSCYYRHLVSRGHGCC